MTDPPAPPISLRDFLESRFNAHDRLHQQHDAAHDREHEATDLAISKAETATNTALLRAQEVVNERFNAANAWRAAMNDRERTFIPKAEYEPRHATLVERMEALDAAHKSRLDALEDSNIIRSTKELERERAATRTMALVGLASAVGGLVLSLLTRLLGIGG